MSISDSENPIEEIVEDDAREAKRGRYGWLSLVVAALFGLFYAYDIWTAIGNLFLVPAEYAQFMAADHVPWWLLWVGVLIPPAGFAVAVFVGRRRNVLGKALIFLVGLAVVAALTFGVYALGDVIFVKSLPAL
jgi:succinate dehydrogenase hydrophobic anchor subunit